MQMAVVVDDVARWLPVTLQWWRPSRWRDVGCDAILDVGRPLARQFTHVMLLQSNENQLCGPEW